MNRGTIILAVFIIVSLIIVGVSQFLQSQPPVQLTIAVDPLAQPWVEALAREFNDQNITVGGTRRVEIQVTSGSLIVIDDIDVWQPSEWALGTPPNLWIPASSASVAYASRLPFQILSPSVARTPLIFAGYSSRVDVLTGDPVGLLSWDEIQAAAVQESWRAIGDSSAGATEFFKIVFSQPDNSAEGLAVLYSAAAHFNDTALLSNGNVRAEFCNWFNPIMRRVPNFNTIGDDVAVYMARSGRSAADIGVGPESRWVHTIRQLNNNAPIEFHYPDYAYVFDFPVALWDDINTNSQTRNAANAFVNWLMEPAQQSRLDDFGFRPAHGTPDAGAALFENGVEVGILLDPPLDTPIEQPDVNDTRSMLNCISRN
jgi:hypothetical protein